MMTEFLYSTKLGRYLEIHPLDPQDFYNIFVNLSAVED